MIPPPPKKCSIYITNHPITSLWLVFHLSCWGFIVRPEKKKTGGLGGDKVITTVRIRWIITTQHRKNDRQSGASATWRMPIELFSNRWAGWHHSDGRFFCIASLSSYNYRTDVDSDIHHWSRLPVSQQADGWQGVATRTTCVVSDMIPPSDMRYAEIRAKPAQWLN